MLEGVEESSPSSEPLTNAYVGHVWNSYDPSSWKSSRDGVKDSCGLPALPSSRRRFGSTFAKRGCPSAGSRYPVQVGDCDYQRPRRTAPRQDWSVRQQPGHRPHAVGRGATAAEGQEGSDEGLPDLQLQHGQLPQAVQRSRREAGVGKPTPLPAATRGGDGGPVLPSKGVQCRQSPWALEERCKCETLCKGGQGAGVAQPTHSCTPQVPPVGRKEHGQSVHRGIASQDARIDVSQVDVFSMKKRPRHFILEIFAGTARISSALRKVGLPTFPIDIDIYPSHDVLDPECAHSILNWIAGGRVMMVWLGMPCTTFSQARRNDGVGPLPLRDELHLWGLPNLKRHDARKLAEGNQLFNFTMKVLHLCQHHHVPYILENPLTSFAWSMPPLQKFCQLYQPGFCDLDFCAYGEIWKNLHA